MANCKTGELAAELLLFVLALSFSVGVDSTATRVLVPVGLILDLNSTVGKTAEKCTFTALSDFYAANPGFRTRLAVHTRDSKGDIVAAASAAVDLIKSEQVHAIIGPQTSQEAKFVIELGEKARVPVVSFSATSPSISPSKSPFFIRTGQDDSFQVKALAAIIQTYGWHQVVPIYEDTEYGNALIPYLDDALQQIDISIPYRCIIPPSLNDMQISEKLKKLNEMQTRVFLVHMTASLGSRLFSLAQEAGMMVHEYAWIITDGLSALLDPVDAKVMDSMQGVLGVRPFVPSSKNLEEFEMRWRWNFSLIDHPRNKFNTDLGVFGLWAYDTVWALAMAAEMLNTNILKQNYSSKSSISGVLDLGVSEVGPRLLENILSTKFKGLSGEFELVQGQLRPSPFEVTNVVGTRERIIGYWSSDRGISRNLNIEETNSRVINELKAPIWPGETTVQPKGWAIPVYGKKLRIGVPKLKGFTELFIKVEVDPHTNAVRSLSGIAYDVFLEVLKTLPFAVPHEFISYTITKNASKDPKAYDDLLRQIKLKKFDAVVGDTTIIADRLSFVDFTFPYTESGVSMVVAFKDDGRKKFWAFVKPLSWDLWLTTGIAFFFIGFVVWLLEHPVNSEFRGPPSQQLGLIFWFPFSTLVFAQKEKVVSNLTKFVLVIWFFVVLILTQSYTANLTSMLTVGRLEPAFVDVNELLKNNHFVGYQEGSFVKDLLTKQLHFAESKLRSYSTPEEYDDALEKGSRNGGVSAIFNELPYLRAFVSKNCSRYTIAGQHYRTDGFGFAFPIGSPLVRHFSRGILYVTQNKTIMDRINKRHHYSYDEDPCEVQNAMINSDGRSLGVECFAGLFIIIAAAAVSALLIFAVRFLFSHYPADSGQSFWWIVQKMKMAKHSHKKDVSSVFLGRMDSRVHPTASPIAQAVVELTAAAHESETSPAHP